MKTIYGRINDIEEKLSILNGGNQCVTSVYRNADDSEPFKIISYPTEKPLRVKLIVGYGFVPPDFLAQ